MRKLIALAVAAFLLPVQIAAADEVPPFDHSDCPQQLPDPVGWRCEVLISDATAKLGSLGELRMGRQRLTFAEGKVNGQYAQVFGALRAEPTPVPGGLLGGGDNSLLRLAFQVQYAGASDFRGDPPRMGFIDMKLKMISPLLPRTCYIGSDNDPIVFEPMAAGAPQPVPDHPELRRTTLQDKRFAIPRAYGCGAFTELIQRRFGVPAPAGTSEITLPTYISIKQYDASHRQ
jgi:hypothetical protein